MDRKKFLSANGTLEAKHRKALEGDFVPEDVHQYRLNRHDFSIYLGGDWLAQSDPNHGLGEPGVEHNMADRFEMNMSILSGINPSKPILVRMASCGGNWDEGMQIFSAIATSPNPVTVVANKWARSMTSIIPLAADRFLIRPPAQYMIHYGSYAFEGIEQEMETDDIERRKLIETMKRLYIARLKEQGEMKDWSERRIRTWLEENFKDHIDVWFSADEAVKLGFADGVYTGDLKTLRARVKNPARRQTMLDVLRRPIHVDIKVS